MNDTTFDLTNKRVWVAGHNGMVGSAVVRRLERESLGELIAATSSEVDLTRQTETERFVSRAQPDVAILAAAKVGGINANRSAQGEFLYDNLLISLNAIEACRQAGVDKVVILGSTCIYPRESRQPMSEEALLTGPLEETNEGYAIAKIAALELGKMYRRQYGMDCISLMPTSLYGPGDNFDLETSHVLPALLAKIHQAKVDGSGTVEIWGTGKPRREFLHVDDLADAVVFTTRHYTGESHLNVGVGQDMPIAELAQVIADVVGWDGEFVFNTDMPDGSPRKLVDVSKLTELGWSASIGLREGIADTYRRYLENTAPVPPP